MRIIYLLITFILLYHHTAQAQCTGTTISVFDITTDSATISWPAPGAVAGYEYAVLPATAAQPTSGTTIINLNVRVGGLLPGQGYKAWHRTNCGGGQYSSWTSISFSTVACGIPATINVTGVRGDSADISWTQINPGANYQYVVDTLSTTPPAGTAINANNTRIKNLKAGKTYYVFVRTDCGSGVFSAWASTSFFTNWATEIHTTTTNDDIKAYPNPAANYIYIQNPSTQPSYITIRDARGQTVQSATISRNQGTIDIHKLPAGFYILSVANNNSIKQFNIVKH